MKTVWKWSLGIGFVVVVSGTVPFGIRAMAAVQKPPAGEPAVFYSQAGRDRVFTQAVTESRKSIYLRTGTMGLIPFVNEILQASQRGVSVHVEMPMARTKAELQMVEVMAKTGVWIELGSRPSSSYEGAYMLVDERVFYYCAGSLDYSEPGIPHSYVRGLKG